MWKYTLDVDGMMCGMCESGVNSAVRNAFPVKSVKSSHTKKKTEIISEEELDEEALRKTITELGHDVGNIQKEPYQKKKFLGLF